MILRKLKEAKTEREAFISLEKAASNLVIDYRMAGLLPGKINILREPLIVLKKVRRKTKLKKK